MCDGCSWTRADMEVACRQLGFQGGGWGGWYDRQPGLTHPRLLLEAPHCRGTEATLQECDWGSRQMGAGVCGKSWFNEFSSVCIGFSQMFQDISRTKS